MAIAIPPRRPDQLTPKRKAATYLAAIYGPLLAWIAFGASYAWSSPTAWEPDDPICRNVMSCFFSPRQSAVIGSVLLGVVIVPVATVVTLWGLRGPELARPKRVARRLLAFVGLLVLWLASVLVDL